MTTIGDFEIILTQDDSSGTVHKRVRLSGIKPLATFEGCNLDRAGAYTIIGSIGEARRSFRFCERCFPDDELEPTVAPI